MLLHLRRGFTLVEVMVSMAIFAFVMVVAVGAFIRILDLNRRAQDIQTAMNNVSFSLEMMTRELRTGSDYVASGNANNRDRKIVFTANVDSSGQKIKYGYRQNGGVLERAMSKVPNTDPASSDYLPITTPIGLSITYFNVDIGNPSNSDAPFALIQMQGTVGKVEKAKTIFETETLVSQRMSN